MSRPDQLVPKARQDQLVVVELANETLVYDEESHEAHCLNKAAAFVWKHCDGRTSVAKMARLLEKRMKMPSAEQVVWLALRQLKKSHLLEEPVAGQAREVQISRRELVRKIGIAAAVTVPLVTSIVAPTATSAQTIKCLENGAPCSRNDECCSGCCCDGCCPPASCVDG